MPVQGQSRRNIVRAIFTKGPQCLRPAATRGEDRTVCTHLDRNIENLIRAQFTAGPTSSIKRNTGTGCEYIRPFVPVIVFRVTNPRDHRQGVRDIVFDVSEYRPAFTLLANNILVGKVASQPRTDQVFDNDLIFCTGLLIVEESTNGPIQTPWVGGTEPELLAEGFRFKLTGSVHVIHAGFVKINDLICRTVGITGDRHEVHSTEIVLNASGQNVGRVVGEFGRVLKDVLVIVGQACKRYAFW